jgi:hypothetical protein
MCAYQGLLMAVLTRNEHCPPHVHVGSAQWEARFEFSFSHNGVRLWNVVPVHKQPTVAVFDRAWRLRRQKTVHLLSALGQPRRAHVAGCVSSGNRLARLGAQ